MNLRRLLLLAVVVALVAGFFASGLQQHLSLDALKAQQQVLDQQVTSQPMLASALYVGLYVLVTALSLPGAALLTLIGGADETVWSRRACSMAPYHSAARPTHREC